MYVCKYSINTKEEPFCRYDHNLKISCVPNNGVALRLGELKNATSNVRFLELLMLFCVLGTTGTCLGEFGVGNSLPRFFVLVDVVTYIISDFEDFEVPDNFEVPDTYDITYIIGPLLSIFPIYPYIMPNIADLDTIYDQPIPVHILIF